MILYADHDDCSTIYNYIVLVYLMLCFDLSFKTEATTGLRKQSLCSIIALYILKKADSPCRVQ